MTRLVRKRNDPAGSPLGLQPLPCGWCQILRTFPSGPSTTVSRPSKGWQSPIWVAWLHRVAVHPKEVTEPVRTSPCTRGLALDPSCRGRLVILVVKDLAAQLDALVTDEDARARDELSDLVPALTAKVASLIHSGHAKSIGLPVRS
jgi:hypothetical protein